jgi:hypothetical protein
LLFLRALCMNMPRHLKVVHLTLRLTAGLIMAETQAEVV